MALLILDRTLSVGKNCQNKSCSIFGPYFCLKNRLLSVLRGINSGPSSARIVLNTVLVSSQK